MMGGGSGADVKAEPTSAITPADVPPVTISVFVDWVTASSPREKACSSRGDSLKDVAPPVTEMSNAGRRSFQYFATSRLRDAGIRRR